MSAAQNTNEPAQPACDETVSRRPRLQTGKADKLGNKIREICWVGEDYTVYRSTKGVFVQFSDCPETERDQRKNYMQIGEALCQLRYLTSQMVRSRVWPTRSYYDHQIVQAMVLALEGETKRATELLGPVLSMAEDRLTNENRVRYLLGCFLTALLLSFGLPAIGLPLARIGLGQTAPALPYLLAAAFGAAGAVFSITLRVESLELAPSRESVMNVVFGALRVFIGLLSGGMLLLLLSSTMFGVAAEKVFSNATTFKQLSDLSINTWTYVAVIGLLGGFAERLLPNLLQDASDRIAPAKPATSVVPGGPKLVAANGAIAS